MTVGELLQRMTSREFSEWMAFSRLEPWGTAMEDWRAGLVASVIANTSRDPKKRRRPFEPADFMPQRDPAAEQSDGEVEDVLRMWQAALAPKEER